MPIYEYQCKKCGHRFEAIQKVTDRPLERCEKCKGRAERLVSSPAIQFKGSGWYITDYARKGSAPESAKTETSSEKSPSDKSSTEKAPAKKGKEKAGASK